MPRNLSPEERWRVRAILAVAGVLVAGFAGIVSAGAVTADDMKEGVGKGLFTLKKLYEGYAAAGIDSDRLDIQAVYHGKAADHLLTDDAWNHWCKETDDNPNAELIAELARLGIRVELCDSRRVTNG